MSVFIGVLLIGMSFTSFAQTTITLGTGTSTNGTTSYPAPYGNYYYGARHQMLVLASELQALGASAGTINSLAFSVGTIEGTPLQGFTISLGATTATSISTWQSGLTQVYTTASYTETTGWNTHTFQTPYVWDGVSNIIVETCFNNSSYTDNAQMHYTTTAFTSAVYYRADASGVCTNTSITGTSSNRPNMQFVIVMGPAVATDLGVISWDSPNSGCGLTATEPVTIKVKNWGTASQSSYTLKYSIDNGTTWTSQALTTTIAPGDTLTHTFSTTANFSSSGTYNVKAAVEFAADSNSLNNEISAVIVNPTISGGSLENFETVANGFLTTYPNNWTTYNSDNGTSNPRWEAEDASGGDENSSSTGPNYDHTYEGISGGIYMFLETSSPSALGDTAWLESPCLNFNGAPVVIMDFWYHMYGSTMGNLIVEQKLNGQWVSTGWIATGQQHSSGTSPWTKATLNISGNATAIRFAGAAGSSYYSDMAIDDVSFTIPPANDIAMLEWFSPASGSLPNATMPITVKVMNAGLVAQDSLVMKYSIDGGTTIVTELYADTLDAGDTLTYTFTTTANMLNSGLYQVGAVVQNVGDANTSNDTAFADIWIGYPLSGTYTVGPDTNDHFSSFTEAVQNLGYFGVGGAVTFLVDSGVYNEQISFGSINGISSTNTITFTSGTGNAGDVVLNYYSTGTADNYVVEFNGASYITFTNLTVAALNSSYATVFEIDNGSQFIRIDGCDIQSLGTSTNNRGVSVTNVGPSNYNTIVNNTISGGNYGIYLNAPSSTNTGKNNVVDSNEVYNYYYYGIYAYYQDSVFVRGNYVHDNTNTTSYGIYTYYIFNGSQFVGNKIIMNPTSSSANYGLAARYFNYYSAVPTNAAPCLVANNMISIVGSGTGTNYGIYAYYSDLTNYYNNSVVIADNSTGSRALYQTNTTSNTNGENFANNSLVNMGAGYAAYYGTTAKVASNNYNNYYAMGTNFVYWGSNRTDLAALQTANSMDLNSVSMNPGYNSTTDLHTNLIPFNNLGSPVTGVTIDFDGDMRDATTPDIGADEFTPAANDLSVVEWVAPMTGINLNASVPITVKVANFGTASQSNVTIKYSLNGGATYVSDIIAGPINSMDTVSHTFNTNGDFSTFGQYNCLAFTDLAADQNKINDTIFYSVFACNPMSGTYTIGQGSGFNFTSFSDAITALNNCGVAGPVVLLADTGVFNERFTIGSVPGASAVNTITIKGSGNTTIFNEPTVSSDRAIITLDGAKHVIIDSLNIVAGPNATYAYGIFLTNQADSNTISNSSVILNNTGSSSNFCGIIASGSSTSYSTNGNSANYLTIENNYISGGYVGLGLRGSSTTVLLEGTKIMNNTFENYTYYGMYLYYHNNAELVGNTLNQTYYGAYYHLYMYYFDNQFSILNNKINMEYGYGIYAYYADGDATNHGLVANNMISQTVQNSTAYGMRFYSSKNIDIINNSILMTSSSTSGYCLYVYNSSSTYSGYSIINNNLVNTGAGYAVYVNNNSYLDAADYNNYYTTGSNFAYWGGARTDLAALQAAYTTNNVNSVSMDPLFISNTDLHVTRPSFDNIGTPSALVTTDIDGDVRSMTTPDIGADEFTAPANDLGVTDVMLNFDEYCGVNNDSVFVEVYNYGSATQTNVPVYLTGTTPSGNLSLTGTLSSIASETSEWVYVGQFTTTAYGVYDMKAYASLSTDSNNSNDTISGSGEYYTAEALGYIEEFNTWPPVKWDVAGNGTFSWDHYSGTAARANFWNQNPGNFAQMRTPMVTVPAATTSFVAFDYSYYDYTSSYADTLSVYAKTCDTNWVLVWKKGGLDLVTPGGGSTSPGTYITGYAQIPTAFEGNNVQIMFEGFSDYGPDLFIDGVTIAASPTVSLGADTSYCAGDSVMLDAGTYFGAAYLWTRGTDTLGTTSSIYATTSGTYTCKVTQFGIDATDDIVVTENALPVLTITGFAANYCDNGMPVALVASPVGGVFTGTGVIGTEFNPATAGVGNHTITYSYTDANGCSNVASQSTMVNAAPVATTSGDVTICEGTSTMLTAGTPPVASDLFFSEYIEGGGNNKAIEIYNGTGDTIFLDNYQIAQATNGNGWQYYHVFPAGSYILNNDVWVILNSQTNATVFDTALADEILPYPSVVHHNGDDARGLVKVTATDTTLIDVIGTPSPDPGSGWAVAGVSNATANHTIVRKAYVTGPDTSWTNIAGTDSVSSQYLVYPQDYFANLGTHTMSGPTSFLWSTSETTPGITVNPVVTTQYYVTITNTVGCSDSDSLTVTVNPMPMVNLGADQTLCASETLPLDAGSWNTYLWSTGDTIQSITIDSTGVGLGTGNFSVMVTDSNSCMGYDTVAITWIAEPVVVISGPTTIKASHAFDLDAGTGFATYLWTNGWTNQLLPVGANTLTGGQDTIFGVTVTDANGCSGTDTISIFVIDDVGMADQDGEMNLAIFPNPSNGEFTMQINGFSGKLVMNILDVAGKVVYAEELNVVDGFAKSFDFSTLAKGVYNIQLISNENVKTEKLIIK